MKYSLKDLIDIDHFQELQDKLNEICSFPSAIVDNDGNILTATAWQEICTQFHRKNDDAEKACIKSDQYIKDHIHEANPALTYRCPHGLSDNAMPIIIEGIHYGNFFTGQFFLEKPNLEFFRAQAKKYGFDEDAYLAAVKKVPIWTQEQLNNYLFFIRGLITIISESALKKLREIENRKKVQESEEKYRSILKAAMDGYWLTDINGKLLEVNNAYCSMSGYTEDELLTMHISDLEAVETPELVAKRIQKIVMAGSGRFESKHRHKDGAIFDVEVSVQFRPEEGGQCVCFLRDITAIKQADKSLRDSEEKYHSLYENAAIGIFHSSFDGRFIDINHAAAKMLGYETPQEVLTSIYNIAEQVYAEPPLRDELINQLLAKGEMIKVEHRYRRKDGTEWDAYLYLRCANDSNGQPIYLEGFVEDITERKKAEEDLRKLAHDQEAILNNVPAYIYFKDQYNNILITTESVAKVTGIAKSEIEGRHSREIYPETADKYWADDLEVIRSGKPKTGIIEPLSVPGEETRWLRTDKLPYFNEKNEVTGVIVFCNDITDSFLLEKKLKESEERLSLAFQGANDGLWDWNMETNEIFYSPRWKSMLGYENHEIENHFSEWERLILPEDLKKTRAILKDYLVGNRENFACEFKMRHKNGTLVDILSRAFAIRRESDNQPIRLVGTHVDITERKKMEKSLQQAQKIESIGTLAGGIAHDFNNILFPIVGLSEMLIDDLPPGSLEHENALGIHKAGRRGSDLVKQILTISRKSKQKKMPIRIQQILKEVVKLSRSTIPVNIAIRQDIEDDCRLVQADPTQIHQIAMNLITNAYHAVESNYGEISVRLREVDIGFGQLAASDLPPGKYAMLSVSDTGVGIDPVLRDKIFEPYFTTKKQGKGTGLGLAVVYGIVKEHQGDIKAYSELEKGSTFNVYLPIMAKPEKTVSIEFKEEFSSGDERILLVDDEESVLWLEKQMLERMGYRVTSFLQSSEALESFMVNPTEFDLVITDMTMPLLTGDQFAEKILSVRADMPVIICTGFSERIDKEKAKIIGIKGLLMKPVVKAEMAKMIRKVLDEDKDSNQE